MTVNHPEVFIFILSSTFVLILFGFQRLDQTAFGQVVMRKRKWVIAYLQGVGALVLLALSEEA